MYLYITTCVILCIVSENGRKYLTINSWLFTRLSVSVKILFRAIESWSFLLKTSARRFSTMAFHFQGKCFLGESLLRSGVTMSTSSLLLTQHDWSTRDCCFPPKQNSRSVGCQALFSFRLMLIQCLSSIPSRRRTWKARAKHRLSRKHFHWRWSPQMR